MGGPRKGDPAKMKTFLRHPVEKASKDLNEFDELKQIGRIIVKMIRPIRVFIGQIR
jgi:hypothetical protein